MPYTSLTLKNGFPTLKKGERGHKAHPVTLHPGRYIGEPMPFYYNHNDNVWYKEHDDMPLQLPRTPPLICLRSIIE